ncbi:hypothetical protein PybrP1_010129 [[Pythium] brassicae (nom. inval.)]|nr:hypothetical protein PybrP1_010129 [[Pythium] brassicae (nom. inval.)]
MTVKKRVRWSTVTVYEFGVGIGGSAIPKRGGPSIGLARTPKCVWSSSLDDVCAATDDDEGEHERVSVGDGDASARDRKPAQRKPQRLPRRRKVRWLKPLERVTMLTDAGCSERRIYRMMMECSEIAIMSLYTLKHLLHDCSARMTRTKCAAADKKRETLEDIWRAFNDWISSRFDVGKGVHIATFASISWETCTNSRNQPKLRPVFVLSDTFARTYGLQHRKPPSPGGLGALEEINFTKIAIKFSRTLTKDLVFSGVRDLLQRLGELAGAGAQLSIAFSVGRLVAKNRVVSMVFDPVQIPRALEADVARSLLGSPLPSQLGDVADFDIPPESVVDFANFRPEDHHRSDKERAQVETLGAFATSEVVEALPTSRSNPENVIPAQVLDAALSLHDELEMLDLMPPHSSPSSRLRSHREGIVMESAFKRHVSSLAEDVELEAKYAFDSQLQQRRDVEAIAHEARTRRQSAEDMQRHLRVQMDHQRSARYNEKHEQKGIEPSASSFYCDSEQTRLGYEDAGYLQRTKQELKEQLLGQISGKEQARASDRRRSLQDDSVFLRRLRDEMDSIEHKQSHERAELRKTLTESWRRDATIKKLVEAKKKHRAAEQVRRADLAAAQSPGRAGCLLPESLTPRSRRQPTTEGGRSDHDFSVGFDIRSVCE